VACGKQLLQQCWCFRCSKLQNDFIKALLLIYIHFSLHIKANDLRLLAAVGSLGALGPAVGACLDVLRAVEPLVQSVLLHACAGKWRGNVCGEAVSNRCGKLAPIKKLLLTGGVVSVGRSIGESEIQT